MKRVILLVAMAAIAVPAFAIDHNNIDGGRPLRFDDAYSIAYRERAIELGLMFETFRRRTSDIGLKAEFKYGFAKNQDIGIGFDPTYSGEDRKWHGGDIEFSYFNGFQREIGDAPALGMRVDLAVPTDGAGSGVRGRVRGIATKALGQYDKVHLNLDAGFATDAGPDERDVTFGLILGYSTPLGYPRRFDQTLVAEFALTQSGMRGEGFTGSVGLGLRKQMGPRSVFDIGLQADLFSTDGAPTGSLRFGVGYSYGF